MNETGERSELNSLTTYPSMKGGSNMLNTELLAWAMLIVWVVIAYFK